ncbi:MAG: hypothetical protein WD069_11010 [Planctomycetales bacterium]
MAAIALLAGCDSEIRTRTAVTGAGFQAPQRAATPDECRSMLDNALAAVQPERLGISSDAAGVTTLLNQWRGECGSAGEGAAASLPDEAGLERLFPGPERDELLSDRYVPRDAELIRDGLLFRRIAAHAARNANSDLERAVALFDWVSRNVMLLADDDPLPSTTPFHAALFGEGRAEDRAWLVAELLRHLQIDAVVVRPPGDYWLVGVPLDGKLHLFDVRLGLPVPSTVEPDGPFVPRPATLDEVLANGELLEQLAAGDEQPYPVDAEGLRQARVELIGTPSLWAPRMERLQAALVGERFVNIHQPLAGTAEAPGLLERVEAVFGDSLKSEDYGIWPWAMQHGSAAGDSAALAQGARARFEQRLRHFDAPYGVVGGHGDFDNLEFGWKHGHRDARLKQLAGEYDSAAADYLKLRFGKNVFPAPVSPVPPEIQAGHDGAAEDGFFWTGAALLEEAGDARDKPAEQRGLLSEAEGSLRDYLGGKSGTRWANQARLLFARALATRKDYRGAIAVLESVPAGAPQRATASVLVRRWQTLSAAAGMR